MPYPSCTGTISKADSIHRLLDICLYFAELNTGQIQEAIGEAVNGIVKHFHKPEKEVRSCVVCVKALLS